MPTNTRTGTNTSSNLCDVSPSQAQAANANLERRVAALEAVLSRLLGGNVSANQLSDITSNGGVITDVVAVASNAAGGWTTDGTFTGVAISTLGWKMSDGNSFPIVQMVNGRLVYGFNKNGTISTDSSGTGAGSLAIFRGTNISSLPSLTDQYVSWTADTEGGSNDSIATTLGTSVRLNQTGKYMINVRFTTSRGTTDDAEVYGTVSTSAGGTGGRLMYLNAYFPTGSSSAFVWAPNGTMSHRFTTGTLVKLGVSKFGTGAPGLSNAVMAVALIT